MLYSPEWEKKDAETTPREPWREVCLTAADLLEKHGHCKGAMVTKNKHMCLFGSLQAAAFNWQWDGHWDFPHATNPCGDAAYKEASARIERAVFKCNGFHGAVNWNDAKERKSDEVIALLREVGNAI